MFGGFLDGLGELRSIVFVRGIIPVFSDIIVPYLTAVVGP